MSIKLAAIDLDDTLLNNRHMISPACVDAIRRVKEQGVYVVLATGRMYRAALPFAQQLELEMPLIAYQGALVKNSGSGEVLYERTLDAQLSLHLIDFLEFQRIDYHIYCNDQVYARKMLPLLEKHARVTGINPVINGDMAGVIMKTPPLEIMAVFQDYTRRKDVELMLRDRYHGRLHLSRFKYNTLEIMDRLATKAQALATVAARLGVQQHEVMAIGDSHNDVPMIEWAGIGVAVGNAHPRVKAAADFITGSNEEEGVIAALEKFIG